MIERAPGKGWLALVGGGEFSFGETEAADLAWLRKAFPAVEPQLDDPSEDDAGEDDTSEEDSESDLAADDPLDGDEDSEEGGPAVGFVPAASGSTDYGEHFAVYLDEYFDVDARTVPIFRARDARRGKNLERLASFEAIYLGGGVTDHLLEALAGSPALDTLRARLSRGGVVAAIAASAQALGRVARSVFGGATIDGLGLLPHAAIEANFSANAPELRRLRQMMQHPEVTVGLGIAAGSAVLLGPDGAVEVVGEAWRLDDPEGDPVPLGG